jgi:hypothetical protein
VVTVRICWAAKVADMALIKTPQTPDEQKQMQKDAQTGKK